MEITVYDEQDRVSFHYTKDMKPETFPPIKANEPLCGPFELYYLSDYEEDGTESTSCSYPDGYYAVVTKVA